MVLLRFGDDEDHAHNKCGTFRHEYAAQLAIALQLQLGRLQVRAHTSRSCARAQ
jgi:hypothetical protein